MDLVDSVMRLCCEFYQTLPKTGKPKGNEWTTLAAVVGIFDDKMEILSLGTGSKCIGRSLLSPSGDILNDSHAEVIARRAFLKYLYMEIVKLNETDSSDVFYRKNKTSFRVSLKGKVRFCFVTSVTPCGDASIIPKDEFEASEFSSEMCGEVVSANKDKEPSVENIAKRIILFQEQRDVKRKKTSKVKSIFVNTISSNDSRIVEIPQKDFDTCDTFDMMRKRSKAEDIHRTGAKCLPSSEVQDSYLPGVLYHETGVVRTKPGRGDPTASVSCSDKLARWNVVGIQGALLSLLITDFIFMDFIIVGGGCPFSKTAFDRAINTRIEKAEPTPVHQSTVLFEDRKSDSRPNPCSTSISWCQADGRNVEVSVNGRKQGVTKKNLNKISSRVSISKKELLYLFHRATNSFKNNEEFITRIVRECEATDFESITYKQLKAMSENYRSTWENIKSDYFKVWTEKPENLLDFTVTEID